MSTYVPIQTIILSSTTASIEFTSIPQTYTDLVIIASAQRGVSGSGASGFQITLNDDSGSNYSSTLLYEGSPFATRLSNQTSMQFAGVAADGHKGTSFINFQNYSNTTMNKTVLVRFGNSTEARLSAVLWRSTSAITKIKFNPANGFASGSTFTLYGIGTGSPKAFGGTTVVSDGTYWYHAFQSSGVFEPLENITADYLVVAGGGGGGSEYVGGGGGAGGLRVINSQSFSANNKYTCTIGAGGPGGSTGRPGKKGFNGSNSSFSGTGITTINTTGGGGGASTANSTTFESAGNGGSGGGGTDIHTSAGTGNAGSYSPVEGYNGGGNASATAGGGGGAGAVGGTGNGTVAGNGGIGANSYNSINFSSWLTATKSGSGGYLAGGGGGAAFGSRTAGIGGAGGGGNGANQVSPINATDGLINTGSGGGGTERNGTGNGASGGSGLIIVRYPV